MAALLTLLPTEFVSLLIVASGVAMMVGAHSLGGKLFVAALAMAFLPFFLAPLFDAFPTWLLLGVLAVLALGVLRVAFDLVIGRRSTDHMVGILAADVVRYAFVASFRLLGWIFRAIRARI